MATEIQKVYSAIAAAKKDVDAIGKNRKNSAQGYSFRGIDDAMDAFSPLLAKHGLTVICDSINHLSSEGITSKGGGTGWRVVNNYVFRIYAEDGSYVQGQSDGEAVDYGDKCTTKAQSVALREFLFKTFMVPFHTVDDIEEASHDLNPVEKQATPISTIKPLYVTKYQSQELSPEFSALKKAVEEGKYQDADSCIAAARLKYSIPNKTEEEIRKLFF